MNTYYVLGIEVYIHSHISMQNVCISQEKSKVKRGGSNKSECRSPVDRIIPE